MRIPSLILLVSAAACVAPLQTTTSMAGTGSTGVGTTATTASTGSSGTSSVENACQAGSIACCDATDCYCLLYCPICDSNNVRECIDFGQGPECICVQGGSGTTAGSGNVGATGGDSATAAGNSYAATTGGIAGSTTSTAGSGNAGSTGCGAGGAAAATGGCAFPDRAYCCAVSCNTCDCKWYTNSPASCAPCEDGESTYNGNYCTAPGACSPLGNTCYEGSECCSTFCSGTCVATPDGGADGTIGTTGSGTNTGQ